MLTNAVPLGNIDDAEAFVRHCINKSRIVLTPDERDELVAEGLVLLCELHQRYNPARDKAPAGKTQGFFGYALYLLPRKLNDAWHRSQPHHLLRTQSDGTRRYEYVKTARSLEELHTPDGFRAHDTQGRTDALHAGNCRTTGDYVAVPLQKAA